MYQSNGILEEVMKVYYRMMDALGDVISDKRKKNDGIPLAEYLQIESDQGDYEDMGNTDASRRRPRRVVVLWSNCLGDKLILLSSNFVLLSMPLTNLIRMWYYVDVPNNIPSYKML